MTLSTDRPALGPGAGDTVTGGAAAGLTAEVICAGQTVDLAGFATWLWASGPARAAAMAAALRPARPAPGPPSIDVTFDDGALPELDWSGTGPYEVRREQPDLVYVRSDRGLAADVTPDRISVVGDAPDLLATFRRVFSIALAHLMSWHDRHVLHAAALSVDDGCILVLGPSGAGKSTVALCALRCGWTVLGDDLVVLAQHGGRIDATAVPRPLTAPRDLVDDPHSVPVPGDPRGRLELPPGATAPGTSPVIGSIVVTHGDSDRSGVRDLDPFALPPVVLASSLVTDGVEMRRALFFLSVALSRLPSVELAHGSHPGRRLEDGTVLLEEIRGRFRSIRDGDPTCGMLSP